MHTLTIGVLGAGFIGATLATKLAARGHRVRIANSKSPATLSRFDDIANVTPMWAADVVSGVDVVIISVPERTVESLAAEIAPLLSDDTIVIDTGNYYPNRDGHLPILDGGVPDSVWVSQLLGRDVFKVFNNIGAPSLKNKGSDVPNDRVGLSVAGPDGDAKSVVFALVEHVGFEPVDGGTLDASWRQQPGTPSYCKDFDPETLRASLAATTSDDLASYHRNRDEIVDFDAAAARLARKMQA